MTRVAESLESGNQRNGLDSVGCRVGVWPSVRGNSLAIVAPAYLMFTDVW